MENKEFTWFDDREVNKYIESEEGKRNSLPSISIACAPKCNMACPHCIYDAGNSNENSLSKDEKLSLLEESVKLGARFLQVCHEGEPMLDSSVMPLIKKAYVLGMKIFMYSNASKITSEIAKELYDNEVCLGIHFDSLKPDIFDKMLGRKGGAEKIYNGTNNLIEAGYNRPFKRNGKLYTKMGLVTTLTSLNTQDIQDMKDVAKYAWDNNVFFGLARLEEGGRATGEIWNKMSIPEKEKQIRELVDWCSEQTGIDYWYAQPKPYCIGVCGLQIGDKGDVWMTKYAGSCDFTEPDGQSYPDKIITIGNVRKTPLSDILQRAWGFRQAVYHSGVLDKKLQEYEKTKDVYPNGLQDCGSARTHTLFVPFYNYVRTMVKENL